jgi:exopolyphosphatase/guanosine-5'-triphosphate,3'-diphosphate pyrophosphatase
MRVAVVDVGSNTVRLLVSRNGDEIYRLRSMLRLGEAVERFGEIPPAKLEEAVACVAEYVAAAHERGAHRVEVLVTSPGRQASNGDELRARLAAATGVPVRVLSADEEGRLAFLGAVSARRHPATKSIAVVDVGGGSAQVVVGTRRDGPAWSRSIDLGSLRLAARLLPGDPPGDAAVATARADVARYLDAFTPPLPQLGLAVGGSARAIRAIVGPTLGADELEHAIAILASTAGTEVVARYGVHEPRVRTLAAGAVILRAIQERLGVPLRVSRGGVREGAAAQLVAEARRAAA